MPRDLCRASVIGCCFEMLLPSLIWSAGIHGSRRGRSGCLGASDSLSVERTNKIRSADTRGRQHGKTNRIHGGILFLSKNPLPCHAQSWTLRHKKHGAGGNPSPIFSPLSEVIFSPTRYGADVSRMETPAHGEAVLCCGPNSVRLTPSMRTIFWPTWEI